jgi:hypothetical protein
MAMFPAFLDTCTLYGAYLCDSLLRLAEAGTYRPLWSADVLDELERALVARGLEKKAVTHRIGEMRRAFPDAEVRGYENLVDTMTCDPKGEVRHAGAEGAERPLPSRGRDTGRKGPNGPCRHGEGMTGLMPACSA